MKLADIVCIGLIAWAIFMILQGCAAVPSLVSATGAGATHYRFTELEERVKVLEDQDLWSR